MLRKVRLSPDAIVSLGEARRWLLQAGAGKAARDRWEAVRTVPRRLKTHPYLGAIAPDFPPFRQVIVSGYRLIYRIDPDTGAEASAGDTEIIVVFGPGQATNSANAP